MADRSLLEDYGPGVAGLLTDAAVGTGIGMLLHKHNLGAALKKKLPFGMDASEKWPSEQFLNFFGGNVLGGGGSALGAMYLTNKLIDKYKNPLENQ